ncbi:hypothetical protein [Mycobacteroides abscessus]|uniref:hypothetical protein n=1 Tax=Mycobacteroides abscessus TaxID=36809 RepID=UPI001054B129|nr:hypothetical protein [Mycobacteroides abscessus]
MARRWSDEELAVGLNRSLSATEAADKLGRSVKAVQEIRAKYPPGRTPATFISDVYDRRFALAASERAEFDGVPNWQGTTDPVAERTLNTLLHTVLSLAVDNLRRDPEFEPFAVTARGEFQHALLSGEGENQSRRTANLVRLLANQANHLTAFAMAHATHLDAGHRDAVEIRIQHRDGLAITVYAPYVKYGKAVAVGELTAENTVDTIW